MSGVFQRSHEYEQRGRRFVTSATEYFCQCFDLFFMRTRSVGRNEQRPISRVRSSSELSRVTLNFPRRSRIFSWKSEAWGLAEPDTPTSRLIVSRKAASETK